MILAAAGCVRGRVRERPDPRGRVNGECYTGACTCAFVSSLRSELPEQVQHAAIYTKTDGVVDWRSCMEDDDRRNTEVDGTHVGLAFNPQVYRRVARLLTNAR